MLSQGTAFLPGKLGGGQRFCSIGKTAKAPKHPDPGSRPALTLTPPQAREARVSELQSARARLQKGKDSRNTKCCLSKNSKPRCLIPKTFFTPGAQPSPSSAGWGCRPGSAGKRAVLPTCVRSEGVDEERVRFQGLGAGISGRGQRRLPGSPLPVLFSLNFWPQWGKDIETSFFFFF